PLAAIVIEGLEPPYDRWDGGQSMEQEVPPGRYRVLFRLGSEVFSQAEVDVADSEQVEVTPRAAASSLIAEALEESASDNGVIVSETIGAIRAAVLPTMLAIIGIKPFDTTGQLVDQFRGLVQVRDPGEFGWRPLSLVVAIDGDRWPVSARKI